MDKLFKERLKTIVLITSGQPSLNPRLVKEADALTEKGYKVTVIYQYWNDWGTNLDQKLLASKKWKAYLVGGSPLANRTLYLKSRLSFKLAKFLTQKIGFKNTLAEQAIGRCTPLLIKKAKIIKADLYIAHNLAALPVAVLAAKKNKAKCGFDAEDFHRNEVANEPLAYDVRLKTHIEDKYIELLDYLSTASPLITSAYKQLYQRLSPITILNAFDWQELVPKKSVSKRLRLFWFSQTIGPYRGLENVIEAIGKLNNTKIELHLLGHHNTVIKTYFSEIAQECGLNKEQIYYYSPIPADEIFSFAAQFDIGLATEINYPKNRDICLTNKIFTYIQSGLAIVASATSAQKQLLEEYPDMGVIYEAGQLCSLLQNYVQNHSQLRRHQENASKYARTVLNWNTEKDKFLTLIQQTLSS